VDTSKVRPKFNRVVGWHHAWRKSKYSPNVIFYGKHGTDVAHEDSERNLIQVVVKNLTKWTAVIGSASLFPVSCIYRLVPKLSENAQVPYPRRQDFRKGGI
jgi:hypothetical protein